MDVLFELIRIKIFISELNYVESFNWKKIIKSLDENMMNYLNVLIEMK